MEKPAREMADGMSVKMNRWPMRSEIIAKVIARPKAQAHGGTDNSCVRTLECPKDCMMAGAK